MEQSPNFNDLALRPARSYNTALKSLKGNVNRIADGYRKPNLNEFRAVDGINMAWAKFEGYVEALPLDENIDVTRFDWSELSEAVACLESFRLVARKFSSCARELGLTGLCIAWEEFLRALNRKLMDSHETKKSQLRCRIFKRRGTAEPGMTEDTGHTPDLVTMLHYKTDTVFVRELSWIGDSWDSYALEQIPKDENMSASPSGSADFSAETTRMVEEANKTMATLCTTILELVTQWST